jgi:hypothetical protein
MVYSRHPASRQRGASRSSRTLGGMRWTRRCRACLLGSQGEAIREWSARARRAALLRTAKACGPGTRCWCQVGEDVSAQPGADTSSIRRRRWQDEFVAGESTPYVVTPSRAGMPGDSGASAVNTRAHTTLPQRARGCGCTGHPAFPTPSVGRRAEVSGKISGDQRRGARRHV